MAPKRSGNGSYSGPGGLKHPGMAPAQGGPHPPIISNLISNPIISITVDTLKEDTTANMMTATMELAEKVMRIEERTLFLGEVIRVGRGTPDVENFVKKQEKIRHELKENRTWEDQEEMIMREREIVLKCMENKLNDNIAKGARKGRELGQLKGRLMWRLGRDENRRRFNNRVREAIERSRRLIRKDHQKQIREIRIGGKKTDKERIKKYKLPPELNRYKKAGIFQSDADEQFKPGQAIGPVVVGLEADLLDKDEVAIVVRGPKFCVRRILSEERFMIDCERSYFKLRIEMMDKDDDEIEEEANTIIETDDERKERERIEKAIEEAEMLAKTVFDEDGMSLDYGRKRATDCKHNTYVKLPRPKSARVERDIEYRRLTWRKVYRDFRNQFADEDGIQESNLTEGEERGLKKLQKRVREGELIVVKTDKSGRFSLMSLKEYQRAGEVHTAKDSEVDLDFLIKNQKKVNGHISMLLKTFLVGESHGHYERIRNLKLTHSLSVAPLYLLFKDHKGWTLETGKPPPSRPVVSAGSGQNDHLSEIISHILEPVIKMRPGGMEVTSTSSPEWTPSTRLISPLKRLTWKR